MFGQYDFDCLDGVDELSDKIEVTLLANAGLIFKYNEIVLMVDGVFGPKGHMWSHLSDEDWDGMLNGLDPFKKIDYLLFTHVHPDHFSPTLTLELLHKRKVKGLFFPDTLGYSIGRLKAYLKEENIPAVLLQKLTDNASFQIEPEICVRAFSTFHLDEKYHGIPHFCYILSLDKKNVFIAGDIDYINETLWQLNQIELEAAFVNPYFFSALERGNFFRGKLLAANIVVYHVPFKDDDMFNIRSNLKRNLDEWKDEKRKVQALTEKYQTIFL